MIDEGDVRVACMQQQPMYIVVFVSVTSVIQDARQRRSKRSVGIEGR